MPYTKQNSRIASFHIETDFLGGTGTALAVKTTAHVESVLVNDADENDVILPQRKIVRFDMLDPLLASTNIVAAGKTVNYPQLGALIRQASLDQATAQSIS